MGGVAVTKATEALQQQWKTLYTTTLPAAAKARSSVQKNWPVTLDHCFARIILDNAVGQNVPWMSKIKSPAYKNMNDSQLRAAIDLGEGIMKGDSDLNELNQKSLEIRGKKGPPKGNNDSRESDEGRKRSFEHVVPSVKDEDQRKKLITARRPEELQDFDIKVLNHSNDLTAYRKKVLCLLYTVPKGKWTTYKAMSDALHSSPRAVGNAMRNNPFAPMIPCHRVLASDGSIGGFGGSWGPDGEHTAEKLSLLRSEGIKFDGKGKVVGRPYMFPDYGTKEE